MQSERTQHSKKFELESTQFGLTENHVAITSGSYRIKLIDLTSRKTILQGVSPRLLSYIDFNLLKRPLILLETNKMRQISTSNKVGEVMKYVLGDLQHLETEINVEWPLIAAIGISRSKFAVEGALLQIFHVLYPFKSTEIPEKFWIMVSSTSEDMSEVVDRLEGIMDDLYPARVVIKIDWKTSFEGVLLRAYIKTSNLHKMISLLENFEEPLFNLDLDESEDSPSNFELDLPLIEEV